MIDELRRRLRAYAGYVALAPKLLMAYSGWFWMEFVLQIFTMALFVYFWRAVYANTDSLGGLELQQTLNYIILAQIFIPLINNSLVLGVGHDVRQGQIIVEMLRPLDYQELTYVNTLSVSIGNLIFKLPLLLIAWLAFGLTLPSDPRLWLGFLAALLLGYTALFCFDWMIASLAFYTTEVWGLHVVRAGISLFASGALVPLAIMPERVRQLVEILPFSQALYEPVAIVSGITPAAEIPRTLLIQALWLASLFAASRAIFNLAVRRVTVQGG